ILKNLDFECHQIDAKKINIKVPEYRRDVYRVEDVMEEVLRIYGFNQVPIPKKWHISFQNKEYDNSNEIQRTLSNWFVSNGFNEVVNNSLSNDLFENKLDKSSGNTKVSILNPLSSELASMRRTLLFGLLENIKYNQNRQQNNLKFFEFGKIYEKSEKGFHETRQLAFVVTGNDRQESWRTENKAMDFFDVKAICISLGEKLGLKLKENDVEPSMFFDATQFLSHKKKVIIEYGGISQELKNKIGFKGSVLAGILNIDHLLDHPKAATVYKELPKTFFVKRDFSLILDKSVSYASIQKIVRDSERNLLKDMNLFDVYEGKNLPEDKKSYAVSFIFQDPKETLQDAQIDKVMEKIRLKLKSELGAELRA
ncbi:MAG: phenylalanine--tRNA ligase subunit beta, partial [Crocinitomicaceae bacterium]